MLQDTDKIRNITIVGHGSTGKTTLTEQILFNAGVIPKAERAESGRTQSDFSDDEIGRGISIHTTLFHFPWKNTKINIFDTPGSGDFTGEVVCSLRSAESALLLVGARSGVQIETIKLWRRLDNRNMPRMIFVNKLDKAQTDYYKTLEDLRQKFSNQVFIPVTIPIGHCADFKGVVNLLNMKAYYSDAEGKLETEAEIPADMKEEADKYRLLLMEEAAEGDEELLDLYVEKGVLDEEQIKLGLREGLEGNKFVPVFCGSALMNTGVAPFLDFVAWDSPCPFRVEEPCVTGESSRMISPEGDFSAMVFKTTIDQFAGRLSYIKVITGILKPDSEAYNPRLDKKIKFNKFYTPQGKNLVEVQELAAGDIGILAKIDELKTNDTLCSSHEIIHYRPLALPRPVHSVAVNAAVQKDEDKLAQLLQKACDEDLTYEVQFNPETKETVLSSMGELHLAILLDKIRNSKVELNTKVPKIPYRETITKRAEAEYTHKKQTGGHGQYAKVVMDIHPLERGAQFEFTNSIKGGSISKGYLPGIEKGVVEGMEEGYLAGYPLVDIAANISDGKEHPVDSSELAFKLAGKGALKEALAKAGTILLEPIMNVSIFVEDKYLGDVLADLSARRARVLGQDSLGGEILEIKAQVPHGEMLQYALQLKSITSGTGAFEMDFDHYSQLNAKEAQVLIQEYQNSRNHG